MVFPDHTHFFYSYYCCKDDEVKAALSFEERCENAKRTVSQSEFWYFGIINLTSNCITYPSIQRSQFCYALPSSRHLYTVPYVFANNNTDYACWRPFHSRDKLTLEQRHPALHHVLISDNLLSSSPSDHFLLRLLIKLIGIQTL